MLDRVDRNHRIELAVVEGKVFGHHVEDPVGAGHLGCVRVGIDTGHVDPPLGQANGQMALPTSHFEHPLSRPEGEQPVDAAQVGRIPTVDQRVAA